MSDCLFCNIAQHKQEADIIYEDGDVIAFNDIHPIAPVHVLIIPKHHIASVADLADNQAALAGALIIAAKKIAEDRGIAEKGYKLLLRVRRHGGQEIDHLHLHLLGGARLTEHIRPMS